MNSSSKPNTNVAIAVMIAVVCIIAAISFLSGCKSNNKTDTVETEDTTTENVTTAANLDENVQFTVNKVAFSMPQYSTNIDAMAVVTDTTTGVEYLYVYDKSGYGSGCSITPLYNADGTLKTNPLYNQE